MLEIYAEEVLPMDVLLVVLPLATAVAELIKAVVDLIRAVLKTRHKDDDR